METQPTATASPTRPDVATAQGLLIAFSSPPAADEAAFNAWYQEHAAGRLTVPGVLNARRYQAAREDGPRYMASYDLTTPQALDGPEYRRLQTDAPPSEREMMARLPLTEGDRRRHAR